MFCYVLLCFAQDGTEGMATQLKQSQPKQIPRWRTKWRMVQHRKRVRQSVLHALQVVVSGVSGSFQGPAKRTASWRSPWRREM